MEFEGRLTDETKIRETRGKFDAEFREWRRMRPEFAALCAGIKAEADDGDLFLLAAAAGCGGNEIAQMRYLRRRAIVAEPAAKKAPACRKRFEAIELQWRKLSVELEKTGDSNEERRLIGEMYTLEDTRRTAQREALEEDLSVSLVTCAREKGLI